ncbi:MAG: glycoside hydrolase family 31 protein [Chloroflexi bacterium]|nr:glycoside hydrolase family 31 protein [Chloroflexota bacterium]
MDRFESVRRILAQYEPIGAAESWETQLAGLRARSGAATVEVIALAPDLFRVGMFGDGRAPDYASEAIAKTDWRPGPVRIEEDADGWRIATSAATACIRRDPIRVHFEDGDGRVYAADDPDLGMGFVPLPSTVRHFVDPIGRPVRLYKRRLPTERYFGCGERTSGLDKTDSHQVFWNISPPLGHTAAMKNLYTSIPFLLALDRGKTWGLFFDNTQRVEMDLAHERSDRSWFGADGGHLVYYVFAGPTPRAAVDRYTELTGRTPLPPLWALGNQQSSWNYETATEILQVARELRERDIPCDVLYLDIDYMDGFRIFTWDRDRFPEPRGFVTELAQQGFRIVTIVDPGVKVDVTYPVYRSAREAGLFCQNAEGGEYQNMVWPGLCAFPDFTNPRTREWWGEQLPALLDQGVAGIWCDMNEPALFIPRHSTMPPTVVHPGSGSPKIHAEVHNLYGLLMARATRDGLRRLQPDRRPFVISRAGYAGLQRHALQWTGDNSSWWEHLWMCVPQLQNVGLSGIAWVGVDVGGFDGDCDGELLARWTELGIFQAFCRNHNSKGMRPQEPWAFGEPYESVIRKMLKLRQRLIPYLYTLFDECHRTGAPLLRPLLYEFPDDEATYGADDELLLGDALLVAPITRPRVEHRHVYIPTGTWFHYWTGERYDGPAHVLAHAPLGEPAMYVRANQPIPLWPEMRYVGERRPDPLTLLIFPAAGSGALDFYLDSGDGYEHERGAYLRRRVTCETTATTVRVRLGAREGDFEPPWATVELDLRGLATRPVEVRINEEVVFDWRHESGSTVVRFSEGAAERLVEVRR